MLAMTRPRPHRAPQPVHTDAAHRAITAELGRLMFGGSRGPERPELEYWIHFERLRAAREAARRRR